MTDLTRAQKRRRLRKIRFALKKEHGWASLDGVVAPCCYCERLFAVAELTWEHVIPRALGGQDRDNLRLACRECNRTRGEEVSRLLEAWRLLVLFRMLAVPDTRPVRGAIPDAEIPL